MLEDDRGVTRPAIISVAITGSLPQKANNPAVPITPDEQIESTHAAFEAGVRNFFSGTFVPAGGEPNQKVTAMTVGMNWWFNPQLRLVLNYDHTTYDEDILPDANSPGDTIDKDDSVYLRFQVDF